MKCVSPSMRPPHRTKGRTPLLCGWLRIISRTWRLSRCSTTPQSISATTSSLSSLGFRRRNYSRPRRRRNCICTTTRGGGSCSWLTHSCKRWDIKTKTTWILSCSRIFDTVLDLLFHIDWSHGFASPCWQGLFEGSVQGMLYFWAINNPIIIIKNMAQHRRSLSIKMSRTNYN